MWFLDIIGYAASLSVFATFCMQTMLPLRLLALTSNVLFSFYGFYGELYPVLILHLGLLPVNLFRLARLIDPRCFGSCGSQAAERRHGAGHLELGQSMPGGVMVGLGPTRR